MTDHYIKTIGSKPKSKTLTVFYLLLGSTQAVPLGAQ